MLFHRGPARPPPALRFSKKTGPVRLKKIMSGVLILFMCPKWVHKHLQKVAKNVFSLEKLFIDFLILLKENILHWFWWRRQF